MNKTGQKTVLFYTDTPYAGGAENQMYLLAKSLNHERYKVTLVCSDFKSLDDWSARFKSEGIEVVKLTVLHKHDPRHYFQLKDYLKQHPCDLMHIHVWNPASCRYAFRAANKYNVPVVITEHDPFELPKFKKYVKTKLMRNVRKIVTVSLANAKLTREIYPEYADRVVTIHNGIDATWIESQLLSFSEEKMKTFRKNEFNAEEGTKIILTVAELHERKGLEYLIKAMPELKSSLPEIRLIIAGDGNQKKSLGDLVDELKLGEHVKFLGFRKDIPRLMASANLFVLPSIKEAFGLVILEAMACWLPVIATNVGGIPEIIEDGVNGWLVEAKSHDALFKKILDFFNNNFKKEEYILNAQRTLREKFDAKAMAKKYELIYNHES